MATIFTNNVDDAKPDKFNILPDPTGPTSSERRCLRAVVLSLSLLGVFLLAGLIGLGVHYHDSAAEFSSVKANLSERLQISDDESLSLTEERDQLNSTLIEVTKDRDELQSLNHDLAAELSSVKANLTECLQTSLSLTEERDELYSSLAKKQEEVQRLSEHNHGLAAELSSVKANLSECLQTSLSLTEERDELNSNLTKEQEEVQRLSEHNHGLAAELSSVKANLNECLQKSSSLTQERDQLNSKLTEVTKERDELRQHLAELQKTCPSGWTQFSGSCYSFSIGRRSWHSARQDCRSRGGDLVVIDSAQEQTFLSGQTSGDVWIGLNEEREDAWKWVDGTPLTLAYWADGEPNDGGFFSFKSEDCVHIREEVQRDWNDEECDKSFKWICERRAL